MTSPTDTGTGHPNSSAIRATGPENQPVEPPVDELPDWEPLTPELVEEEAVRGDAMLRNLVMLIALLAGWSHIADTSLLTRIKSGEYMASHGFLPPSTDPFTTSAENRTWVNTAWLSDHVLAAVYKVGGVLGVRVIDGVETPGNDRLLTVLAALTGVLTFWVIHKLSRPGVPTWWNSIVAGLAVIAVFPALTAGPAGLTLLGTALLLWLLERRGETDPQSERWTLFALFLFWSNLDPAVWFGLALLWIDSLLRWFSGRRTGSQSTGLLTTAVIATVAAMINPWTWHVLAGPYVLFATEIPEARAYGGLGPHFHWMLWPVFSSTFWTQPEAAPVVALILSGLSLITLILNGRQTPLAHWFLWLGSNGLASQAGVLLPAATIVNLVLAGRNGQTWYVQTFRQTYSLDWKELAFSRGGRAATVLGLFAIAYLFINGAMSGVDGRRMGWGFDWRIRTALQSYGTLVEQAPDDRPFNGRPDHGDYLIWHGQKPFIDSRLALFARGGDNILQKQRDTFRALWVAQEGVSGSGLPDVWKATFDQYKINRFYSRLTGEDGQLKYSLLMRVLLNPELKLTRIDAAAAELVRIDQAAPQTARDYVRSSNGTDFVAQAFRTEDSPIVGTPSWPRPLTTYERWLIQPEPTIPVPGQKSIHYSVLAEQYAPRMVEADKPVQTAHALRVLSIQEARRSLLENPNTPAVHNQLRQTYRGVLGFEQQFGQFGPLNELRVRQMLGEEYNTLQTSAATAAAHEDLAQTLASIGYADLALEHLQAMHDLSGRWTSLAPTTQGFAQLRDQNLNMFKQLEKVVEENQRLASQGIKLGEPPMSVAQGAFVAGCPGIALETISSIEADIVRDPVASIFHAQLLMANGRLEEAWERLESCEALFPPDEMLTPDVQELKTGWRQQTAILNMVRGDSRRAIELWEANTGSIQQSLTRTLLDNAPLSVSIPSKTDLIGTVNGRIGSDLLFQYPDRWATQQLLIAIAELEQGQPGKARKAVESVMIQAPNSSLRPLAVFYHELLTGEILPPLPQETPQTPATEEFQDEPEPAASTTPVQESTEKPAPMTEPESPMPSPKPDAPETSSSPESPVTPPSEAPKEGTAPASENSPATAPDAEKPATTVE